MTDPSKAHPHPRMSLEQIDSLIERSASGTPFTRANYPDAPYVHQTEGSDSLAGVGETSVQRIGGEKRAVYIGADVEFPNGGDPRFRAILSEMLKLHISKSSDYGTGADIYANYRAAEQIGVSAWKSCFIRGLEKVQRIANAANGKRLNHESAENSFLDLANHVVIAKVLYDEEQSAKKSCPCGGNCGC